MYTYSIIFVGTARIKILLNIDNQSIMIFSLRSSIRDAFGIIFFSLYIECIYKQEYGEMWAFFVGLNLVVFSEKKMCLKFDCK